MGKTLGREPYVDGRNHEQMEKMEEMQKLFPKMIEKVHVLHPDESEVKMVEFGLDCCKYEDVAIISNITAQYVKVYANFLQSYKFFHAHEDEIRALLQCGPVNMNVVDYEAKHIFGDDKSYFLCAHVRRDDFITDIMLESTKEFTEPAIEFAFNYLQKNGHNNISLVLLGTDREFIKSLRVNHTLFTKIYTPEPQSRGEDFCLAVNYCDSLIMTASGSTFEWWISYLLPKNAPIFYNSQITDYENFTKDIHDYDIFPKKWIMLALKNGTVYRETKWWYQRNNWTLEMADKYIFKNIYF